MKVYTTADGRKHPYTTFMHLPPLRPGYWWSNVAKLGGSPQWAETPATPTQDDGKLFGYPVKGFLAKQYR